MKTALDFKHKLEEEIRKEQGYAKNIEEELNQMECVWRCSQEELDRFNALCDMYKKGLERVKRYEDALMLVKQFVRDLL